MLPKPKTSAVDIVEESWGRSAPAWIVTLAQACDRESQAKVAKYINRSPSLVNMVLKNRYAGDLNGIENRVNTVFKPTLISCPILGQINGKSCMSHQGQPYNPGNHVAVRLFKACRNCKFKVQAKEAEQP